MSRIWLTYRKWQYNWYEIVTTITTDSSYLSEKFKTVSDIFDFTKYLDMQYYSKWKLVYIFL